MAFTISTYCVANHFKWLPLTRYLLNGFLRRRRQRNYPRMNYLSLPTDEDDEELLDPVSDNEDNDNEGRLSLISAASDDNLLRNEEPC